MMSKLLYLFLSIFFFSCIKSPNNDYYNLSLSNRRLEDFRWSLNPGNDTVRWRPTWVSDPQINKRVFCVEEDVALKARRLPFTFKMAQRFPLFTPYTKADIRIHARQEHVQNAWLKVYALNEQEEVIHTKSIRINRETWQEYHVQISADSTAYLLIDLLIESVPEVSSGAKIWIDKLDIRVDGLSVNDVSRPEQGKNYTLDTTHIIPLSFSENLSVSGIPLLQAKPRIVGLGETISGSLSSGKAKNQIIKWLVEHGNYKLVLVEEPSMVLLKWDLYIQGYPIPLQEIIEDSGVFTFTLEEMTELLEFLKEYNSKQENKVHIIGIDRNMRMFNNTFLYDYLYELYKQKPDPHLLALLESFYVSLAETLSLLNKPQTKACIGRFERQWLRSIIYLHLTEADLPDVKEYGVANARGSILWEHVYQAWHAGGLAKDKCMVIRGSWIQISRKKATRISLGGYLTEYYEKAYCPIGFIGGHGSVQPMFPTFKKVAKHRQLPKPIEGSLEKSAWNTGRSFFYYPAEQLPQYPLSIRLIPPAYELRSWFASNLHERMDGFIFVRECEAGELLTGIYPTNPPRLPFRRTPRPSAKS